MRYVPSKYHFVKKFDFSRLLSEVLLISSVLCSMTTLHPFSTSRVSCCQARHHGARNLTPMSVTTYDYKGGLRIPTYTINAISVILLAPPTDDNTGSLSLKLLTSYTKKWFGVEDFAKKKTIAFTSQGS